MSLIDLMEDIRMKTIATLAAAALLAASGTYALRSEPAPPPRARRRRPGQATPARPSARA